MGFLILSNIGFILQNHLIQWYHKRRGFGAMKSTTAVFIGDSHTWGQRATGALDRLIPPAMAGDLRFPAFSAPCYVNLFRDHMNRITGSSCAELEFGGSG